MFACLSLTLPYSVNRWENVIAAAALFILSLVGLPSYPRAHHKFLIIVGLALNALTI